MTLAESSHYTRDKYALIPTVGIFKYVYIPRPPDRLYPLAFTPTMSSHSRNEPCADEEQTMLKIDTRTAMLFNLYEVPKTLSRYKLGLVDRWDQLNLRPPTQPAYSVVEQATLEQWREQVQGHISARIRKYTLAEEKSPDTSQHVLISSFRRLCRQTRRTEHRLFHIAELLSMILQDAGPEAQVHALYVSHDWRSSALFVISSQTNPSRLSFSRPHAPIEYGQSLETGMQMEPQPIQQEVVEFEIQVKRLLERRHNTFEAKSLYFPARFTQQSKLSDDVTVALDELNDYDTDRLKVRLVPNTGPCWLDFSQFSTNPYFEQLFDKGRRIVQRLGRWEITLCPLSATGELITTKSGMVRSLQDAIGSMQVTYPPTKSLGIYHFGYDGQGHHHSDKALLARICKDDGIRIAELLEALEEVAPKVLSTWTMYAQHLHDILIPTSHWIDDVWCMPGAPKVVIHLDNAAMPSAHVDRQVRPHRHLPSLMGGERDFFDAGWLFQIRMGYRHHITRVAYLASAPFRATREAEWIPKELFEPMKSETGRHPINWDT